MILIINAENRQRFASELADMHRQRKIVFIDRAGWRLPVRGDVEVDAYDHDHASYLIAKADAGSNAVLASSRLLPTTRPHLMSDLFAAACGRQVPRGPAVWEISRFCVSPQITSAYRRVRLFWEMACASLETALLFGVERLTFVAGSALLPLALTCGWQIAPLGGALRYEGDDITALAVQVTPGGLRRVRARLGIDGPVSRFPLAVQELAA